MRGIAEIASWVACSLALAAASYGLVASCGGEPGGAGMQASTAGAGGSGGGGGGGGAGGTAGAGGCPGATDGDCGGPTCPACGLGRRCVADVDCSAGACVPTTNGSKRCASGDVGVWTKSSAEGPSARAYTNMVFDEGAHRALLYGGATDFGGLSITSDPMWSWDGSTWTPLPLVPPSPGPRRDVALAYDSARKRVTLLTGCNDSTELSDAWEWDGAAWKGITATTPPPTARCFAAAAYDPIAQVTVLYGGYTSVGPTGGTWLWNGSNGVDTWTQVGEATEPSARTGMGLVWDAARKRTSLFGGNYGMTSFDETYLFDGATWSKQSPNAMPPGRQNAGVVYDPIRGRTVLYGGDQLNLGSVQGDTWEWDGASWRMLVGPDGGPPPRTLLGMSFFDDGITAGMVVFGGMSPGGVPYDETWLYHVVANPCDADGECDLRHCVEGLCCEQSSCAAGESCATTAKPGFCAPATASDAAAD